MLTAKTKNAHSKINIQNETMSDLMEEEPAKSKRISLSGLH